MIEKRNRLYLLAGLSLLLICPSAFSQSGWRPYPLGPYDAIGSWFGRAVPKPGATICPAGTANCPVPPEIVMIFTFNEDGTFIGIDSNIFAGGNHSTAHGQWQASYPLAVNATFTLLQSSPATSSTPSVFIGGFKNLFHADMIDHDTMQGQIDAYLYSYTNPATGAAIVDSEGLPTPSPLSSPAQCSPPGCLHMGIFTFKARRVNVQLAP
jgi:hypothetical protein